VDHFRSAPFRTRRDIEANARVQRRARSAIPALADFCLIHLASGSRIVCVASAHATREGARLVRALARSHQVRRADRASTVAQVVRLARPIVRATIPHEPPTGTASAIADLYRRLAPRSALAVPIVASGRVLGAVTLCYSLSGRSYVAGDVPAAMRLAARIARAMTTGAADATLGLHPATGHARQGTTFRRRVAARN
jgi:GAF domain-containing protein